MNGLFPCIVIPLSSHKRPSAMEYAKKILAGETSIPKKQADQAFDLLCSECTFLVEAMLNKLIEPLKPEEKRLILIDAIFAALNIDDESELKLLMAEMTNYGAITGEQGDPNKALEVRKKLFEAGLAKKCATTVHATFFFVEHAVCTREKFSRRNFSAFTFD